MADSLGNRISASLDLALKQINQNSKSSSSTEEVGSRGNQLSGSLTVPAQNPSRLISTDGLRTATNWSRSEASKGRSARDNGTKGTEEVDFPPLPLSQHPQKQQLGNDKNAGSGSSSSGVGGSGEQIQLDRPNAWNVRPRLGTNRLRKFDNPYLEGVDPSWGSDVLDTEIHALRSASLIIHTPDAMPTRDELERWLEWAVLHDQKIKMTQLRVLGRQIYLLVVSSKDERDKLLQLTPLEFDGCPVIFAPWTPDFNPKHSRVKRVATWVEFPTVDPLFEPLCDKMLSLIGQPTYRTMTRGQNKYPNVRGCVMVEEGKEKPAKLAFQVAGGGVIVQEVRYQEGQQFQPTTGGLSKPRPGRVFTCGLGGSSQQDDDSDDEFTAVKASKSKWGGSGMAGRRSPGIARSNLFEVLAAEDAGSKQMEDVVIKVGEQLQGTVEPVDKIPEEVEEVAVRSERLSEDIAAELGGQGAGTAETVHDSQTAEIDGADIAQTAGEMEDIQHTSVGNWADAVEEEMKESEARGVKGRLPTDPNHTPDRGNKTKKGPGANPNYRKVDTFQELGVQATEGALEDRRENKAEGKDEGVGMGDPPDTSLNTRRKMIFLSKGERGAGKPAAQLVQRPTSQEAEEPAEGLEDGQPDHQTSPRANFSSYTAPGGKAVVDTKRNGRADTVLLISRTLKVIAEGISGYGYGVWAQVEICKGVVGLVAVHAPRKRRHRAAVWEWVRNIVAEGQWVLIGDLNMVESPRDSIGPSPVLKGRTIWRDHPSCVRDARKKWALALGRIRLLLMKVRDNQNKEVEEVADLQGQLQKLRMECQREATRSNQQEFEKVLEKIRQREKLEVQITRVRSRIRWIQEGDAPTKFFFASWKAKLAQESIKLLQLEDGEMLTEEDDILDHVQQTYSTLYDREPEPEEAVLNRQEVLGLMDKKLTEEQNARLRELPDAELIEEVVRSLPKEKSPGIDGVVVEILILSWHFMKDDCIMMVRKVWMAQKLLPRDNRGVIKLIPKTEDTMWLKNWRPITLLTTTYKIIAKIIAGRLKQMLPGLVNRQQTGFIAGRDILENVLSLRLAQEWAQVSRQDAVFVKLDFQKAYDRVSHDFLWDTLKAAGMTEDNVCMIQGLVVGGQSLVHVNGGFTEEFAVRRGVRQGCPLAPLLFALTTQPLMMLLRREEQEGRITGLNIGDSKSLLHQLYADDTGINITLAEANFNQLQQVIGRFEQVSGAKLNLSKSLIMPLAPTRLPGWVYRSGCEVAEAGTSFRYLGISTSCPIDEKKISAGIIKKMESKIAHWANRLLSWPARTILLRHVLAATPLYQLMSVGLDGDGLDALERLCRQFLWGWNEIKNPKTALVAWDRIAQRRQDGGLNWFRFRDKAAAFHIKLVLRLIAGEDTEWSQLAKSLVLKTLRDGSYQRERCQWSFEDTLLLFGVQKIKGSPTMTRILRSWKKVKQLIKWETPEAGIPQHLTLQQALTLTGQGNSEAVNFYNSAIATLRRGRIYTIADGVQATREDCSWTQRLRTHGIFPEEDQLVKIQTLEQFTTRVGLTTLSLWESTGWQWQDGSREFSWGVGVRIWMQKIYKKQNFNEDLNRWWNTQSTAEEWRRRWRLLWGAKISYRKKIWLWRIFQRGYFTGSRAADIGINKGDCDRCRGITEDLDHVLWRCRVLTRRKAGLLQIGATENANVTLLAWIDDSLEKARRDTAQINLLINFTDTAWKERNHISESEPVFTLTENSIDHI
ncbi:hypothetical protein R1sor_025830 [Riccia sorocarpa]|uniref:Reverse transcriptase domain-containing protein n=1 Tax=Riccia sorocarpa TaxID=122646 RepID=A0ABD3GBB5_9MARC